MPRLKRGKTGWEAGKTEFGWVIGKARRCVTIGGKCVAGIWMPRLKRGKTGWRGIAHETVEMRV